MQKLVSFSLFFLFIWQIVGFVGYFELSHHTLKKEIKILLKKGVPKEDLVFFAFDENQMKQLVWLKKNEFDLNGNLFDVVRKYTKKDGTTYLECISDTQEKILFTKLGQSISSNLGDNQHPTPLSNWFKLLHLPLIALNQKLENHIFKVENRALNGFFYSPDSSLKSVRIVSPPPQYS